jgi:HK97 family phage prohead protease
MTNKQLRTQVGAVVRMADMEQDGKTIIGRAITYNSLSRPLGGFVERFAPGSVADSIRGGIVCALLNHDTSQPIGDQTAGTLRLTDSAAGLDVEIDTPDTSYARDAIAIMRQRGGSGTGMSFGFNPQDVEWNREDGQIVATVRQAQLGEVSVLTGMPPAYAATSAALRSLDGQGDVDIANRYGIDLDKLAAVFLAIRAGLPLTSDEQQIMQRARSLFADVRRPLLQAADERARQLFLD